jgi:hypothetical protein
MRALGLLVLFASGAAAADPCSSAPAIERIDAEPQTTRLVALVSPT